MQLGYLIEYNTIRDSPGKDRGPIVQKIFIFKN